jgi:hypothetical protein
VASVQRKVGCVTRYCRAFLKIVPVASGAHHSLSCELSCLRAPRLVDYGAN